MEQGSTYYHFLRHIHNEPQHSKDFIDLIKDPRFKVSMLWLYGNMGWRQDREYYNKHFHPMALAPRAPSPHAALHAARHALSPRRGLAAFRREEPALSPAVLPDRPVPAGAAPRAAPGAAPRAAPGAAPRAAPRARGFGDFEPAVVYYAPE